MYDDDVDRWPFVRPESQPNFPLESLGWHLGSRPNDWVRIGLAGLYHCAPIGWADDGSILVLRPDGTGRDAIQQSVAVVAPLSGETWLACDDTRDLIPALVSQWLARATAVQWDALAASVLDWTPSDDDVKVLVREPGLTALRELLCDAVARTALCLDLSDPVDAMDAQRDAARRLAIGTARVQFLDCLFGYDDGVSWPGIPDPERLGAWTGPALRAAVWTSKHAPDEDCIAIASRAAHHPPCDDNGWAYGAPFVADAAGARTKASSVFRMANILAGLPVKARSEPLLAAAAAPALNDLASYRGAAHLDASRELIARKDWEGARVALLGLAFWLRGPAMQPEAQTLGLYRDILEKQGESLLLAIARRHRKSLEIWSRS